MLIIGDIHGCYDELQELLAKAGIGDDEPVIALGDIVDRGPDSPRVVEFFRQQPHFHSIMGNHERKHIRHQSGLVKLANSQRITIAQFAEQDALPYADALHYMATFPHYLELPEAILFHGYLEPTVPLHKQKATVLNGTMSGEKYLYKQYAPPWYEWYTGDKPLIVGHRNYTRSAVPFVFNDLVYGLDTGVYEGKALTGLLLPHFRLISVPARAHHAYHVFRQYRHLLPKPRPPRPTRPERLAWPQLQIWLEQQPETSAELAHIRQVMVEVEALRPTIPALLLAKLDAIQTQLQADHPGYADLVGKEQGKLFDTAVDSYPPLFRQILHRLRKGQAIEDVLAKTLQSLADVLTVGQALQE
jgi:serine/threonine protein phosphatase 1